MPQQVFVQVRFQEKTEFGEFNSALYYTQAEFAVLTEKQKADAIAEQTALYVDNIKNSPPPKELEDYTKEELQIFKVEAEQQKSELEFKLIALVTEIGKK